MKAGPGFPERRSGIGFEMGLGLATIPSDHRYEIRGCSIRMTSEELAWFFWIILISLAFGTLNAVIAYSKGRSPLAHFLIGFIFDCIGTVLILCLSNLNEEKARLVKQEGQNRMLREQLRQEQMKLEALRQHTTSRLDTHDKALGIETRSSTPLLGGAEGLQEGVGGFLPREADHQPKEWYYMEGNETRGPFSLIQLKEMRRLDQIGDGTLVFHSRWTEWKLFHQTAELQG